MHPASNQTLKKLMIDHNAFGTEGFKNLCQGLALNGVLTHLSLSYCGLDKEAGKHVQLVLAFIESKLEYVNLQGNALGSEGVVEIFKAMAINTTVTELNLSDNKFSDDDNLIGCLCEMLQKNETLFMCDLKYNDIGEKKAVKILDEMKAKKKTKVDLTDRFSKEVSDEFNAVLKSIKPKKKGKKKSKKKK